MSSGQVRAVRELTRLRAAAPDDFEFEEPRELDDGTVSVDLSLRMGPMERHPDGLPLRERESFNLSVPRDFPFTKPKLTVAHRRWRGRDHVIWGSWVCLYQSQLEWNPADGLYGFFTRLATWLGRAARNDMDPVEGPLEPPHHNTDFARTPFMISADSPAAAGELWVGYAEFKRRPNCIEVTGWNKDPDQIADASRRALAVILPERLPMEYPSNGGQFTAELEKQGLDRKLLLRAFGMGAQQGTDDEPVYLVLGTPARRAADGSPRQHFSVWAADHRGVFKILTPSQADGEVTAQVKEDLALELADALLDANLSWCQVFENREEIHVRRDRDRPMAMFRGKRVLLLGAGALGSWAGEMIVRANPTALDIVDNGKVKPGLLVRQNYHPDEIGSNKAEALAARLNTLNGCRVGGFPRDAHAILTVEPALIREYDLVVDCTASAILQMKLERDWRLLRGKMPRYVALGVDHRSENGIAIDLPRGSPYGPWVASILLKQAICADRRAVGLAEAFYTERALASLFQPEPGCSDPTFAGSAADAMAMVGQFLNAVGAQGDTKLAAGYLFPNPAGRTLLRQFRAVPLTGLARLDTKGYQVLVAPTVFRGVRHFIADNSRKRSRRHETGGLLWGYWDDAAEVVVVTDASGPPPDSRHHATHFICGHRGTRAEHERRTRRSREAEGFVGLWHTHPAMNPDQSNVDILGMSGLVAGIGQNQRRALMAIFGDRDGRDELGVYIYESAVALSIGEKIDINEAHLPLQDPVFEAGKGKRKKR